MASDVMDTGNLPDSDSTRRRSPSSSLASPSAQAPQRHNPQHYQQIPNPKSLSPRASLQLRRHRSFTAVPVDSLARKLSRHSLHHAESLDLHRPGLMDEARNLPSLAGVERYHGPTPRHAVSSTAAMRHSLYAAPELRHSISKRDLQHAQPTVSTTSSSSRNMPPPLSYQGDIRALPTSNNHSSSVAADEGYCDGDEDLSWLDSEHAALLGAANNYRRRGMLSFRTSQEAAMQCSTVLVRNTPRMRRRRRHKQGRRLSTATDISQSSDLESVVSLPTSLSSISLAAMVRDHYV